QATAEADMALIRTKRATTAGQNGGPGQPKSKYRKRSRATPPGKCHSCNIRETPEWRRGPDGARTLCNACGLHYAKLMRKRDKAAGPDGKGPNIDLETLRASTRMAENSHRDANNRSGNTGSNNNNGGSQSTPANAPRIQSRHPHLRLRSLIRPGQVQLYQKQDRRSHLYPKQLAHIIPIRAALVFRLNIRLPMLPK
ncbi:hypothetical protein BGW80DRAFT_1173682, partial [Lactifluus volemus]